MLFNDNETLSVGYNVAIEEIQTVVVNQAKSIIQVETKKQIVLFTGFIAYEKGVQ